MWSERTNKVVWENSAPYLDFNKDHGEGICKGNVTKRIANIPDLLSSCCKAKTMITNFNPSQSAMRMISFCNVQETHNYIFNMCTKQLIS